VGCWLWWRGQRRAGLVGPFWCWERVPGRYVSLYSDGGSGWPLGYVGSVELDADHGECASVSGLAGTDRLSRRLTTRLHGSYFPSAPITGRQAPALPFARGRAHCILTYIGAS
jgi:hypothetical protein